MFSTDDRVEIVNMETAWNGATGIIGGVSSRHAELTIFVVILDKPVMFNDQLYRAVTIPGSNLRPLLEYNKDADEKYGPSDVGFLS